MGVELHVAHTAETRLARARAFLAGLPERSRLLLVAPSLSAATALCHAALPTGAVRFGWFKRTLDMLAVELATPILAARGLGVLRGLGVEALCARVAHELVEARALTRYLAVAERPGFVRALSSTLGELRLAGLSPEAVGAEDADLGRLLFAYEAALASAGLTDRAGVLVAASEVVVQGARLPVGDPLLVLDPCLRTALEARFLAGLCARAPEALITVLHGDERTITLMGERLEMVRHDAPLDVRSDLTLVTGRLFEADAHVPDTTVPSGHVELLSSPGESREMVEVVRRMLEAAGRGVPFDRMAIALRATATYRAVAEEALSRARIPAHFADGVERPCAEGRALLALLECAREGLSARAFAEYLSLGVMPAAPDTPEGEEPVRSPRHWEKLLVDAAVVGGRARWERRLSGLAHELTREAEALESGEPRREALARDAKALTELCTFALPLLDLLEALPHRATWGEWLAALDRLARVALGSPDHVCEVLGELAPLSPMGPIELVDVLRVLGRRLPTLLVRTEGLPTGKVFVGAIDDLLGRSFEHVFVPGLAEKLFPPRVLEDPLLPDAARRRLSSELPSREDAARRERLFLRIAVGAARDRLTVSFPRFDLVHARPRVPSFYGLELLRALDGALPAFDELSRRAHPGAAARMGFPAPERADDAIDDAEYDLAMLDVLLRASPEAQRGAAVFLLRANAHLARALRFRARRWMLAKFTPADGFVTSSEATLALAKSYAVGERAHSPTSLSALAACPYRFFLHAVMRLAPREEVDSQDELDARQRGIFFHAVQRGTLTLLRERGLLPLSPGQLPEAQGLLAQVFEQETQRAREEFAPAIEGVFRDALRTTEADLDEWLRRLTLDRAFTPAYFELGFGVARAPDLDPASTSDELVLANGMRQRGVIDLVERAPDGRLRATDFKTGQVPDKLGSVVSGGRVLQPLLYALALEQRFPGSPVAGGRLYYCTTDAGFTEHEVRLDDHARAVAKDLAQSADALITQGFLPAAPAPKECERCAYQTLCGPYEELRVAQVKRGELQRLSPLYHLRGLP